MKLDKTDRRILAHLQTMPDATAAAVAERSGVSQATCWRRLQRFRETGLIPPQYVRLDRKAAGFNAMVFALVKLDTQGRANLEEFSDAIAGFPEVQECFVLMGSVDFLLRIVTADVEAYERFFFEKLSQVPGVREVTSNIALSEIKSTHLLPLEFLAG
ncbi:MAG: Lrp/AsnC family transcriptional regulator [Pseudomonadota bacterium]